MTLPVLSETACLSDLKSRAYTVTRAFQSTKAIYEPSLRLATLPDNKRDWFHLCLHSSSEFAMRIVYI